jgi:hypothetical protein
MEPCLLLLLLLLLVTVARHQAPAAPLQAPPLLLLLAGPLVLGPAPQCTSVVMLLLPQRPAPGHCC